MIINAENALVGRLATVVAKKALNGETINVVNCGKAIISGNKKTLLLDYKRKQDMGTHTTGPYTPKIPERFVKRIIRGMLPYKNPRGKDAFSRIKCFRTVPEELQNEKMETIPGASFEKLNTLKYLRIEEICKFLGGRI